MSSVPADECACKKPGGSLLMLQRATGNIAIILLISLIPGSLPCISFRAILGLSDSSSILHSNSRDRYSVAPSLLGSNWALGPSSWGKRRRKMRLRSVLPFRIEVLWTNVAKFLYLLHIENFSWPTAGNCSQFVIRPNIRSRNLIRSVHINLTA